MSARDSLIILCLNSLLMTVNSVPHQPYPRARNRARIEFAINPDANNASEYILPNSELTLRIGLVADLDADANDPDQPLQWISYLKEGELYIEQEYPDISLTLDWDDSPAQILRSGLSLSGRGMELSTLNMFAGRLLSCDDHTGIIYDLVRDNNQDIIPTPWIILADGNYSGSGFKCEWATVKDGNLYIGGNGRDLFDSDGNIIKRQHFVKKVSSKGEVSHLNWEDFYEKIANVLEVEPSGYVVHEAGEWSDYLKKWVFMPRYIKNDSTVKMRQSGSNVVLLADENFKNIEVKHIGNIVPTHGFSSFKFIPGTNDHLVLALKTHELRGQQESFIMAFDMNGKVHLPETKIGDVKYEGIEFISDYNQFNLFSTPQRDKYRRFK